MIYALDGNDIMILLDGNDTADGGPGEDWIDYYYSANPVFVNMANNRTDIPALNEFDLFYNVEDIVGSTHNDNITGDANNNKFIPHRGSDNVDGNGGDHDWILYNEVRFNFVINQSSIRIIAYLN